MSFDAESISFADYDDMHKYIHHHGVQAVDCTFVDAFGMQHHCTFSPAMFESEEAIRAGFPFDGSSIPLLESIEMSDMTMHPVLEGGFIDPFPKRKTLRLNCYLKAPLGADCEGCPRSIASRAMKLGKTLGICDTVYFGPEPEFFIFDDVKYEVSTHRSSFAFHSGESPWKSGGGGQNCINLAHRCPMKGNYFPVRPLDQDDGLRADMFDLLGKLGLDPERHHHEVSAGQQEIGIRFNTMVHTADNVMTLKYVVKNVARSHNKTATFMPKPSAEDNGSGMHQHISLWKDGVNLFHDPSGPYFGLSTLALHYIAGILKHAPAVLAFTNPTTNSYKRLVPGFEAPTNLVYSKGNRSAAIRIPLQAAASAAAKRIEVRFPDASCCPHLATAALQLAGLDGIRNKLPIPDAVETNLYDLSVEELSKMKSTPNSLDAALDALEKDYDFLTEGECFTESFIKRYISFKRAENTAVSRLPTPKEFQMYYHC